MIPEPKPSQTSLPGEPEDHELIRRTLQGENEAFDRLVTRYRDRVYRLALHMLWDEQEALDVAQDVFVRAYLALGRFRRDSGFFTWLYRIAVNQVCTQARRRTRRRELTEQAGKAWMDRSDARCRTPDQEAEDGETRARLQTALQQIDPRLREVLVLRELEGYDVQEVSALLGVPAGTVKSRLFRAREDLRRLLKPDEPGPAGQGRRTT